MNKQFLHFNANNLVKVKLTDEGNRIIQEQYAGYPTLISKTLPDEDGWSTFQFHVLAMLFGDKLYNGNPWPPFEMDMMVEIEIGE